MKTLEKFKEATMEDTRDMLSKREDLAGPVFRTILQNNFPLVVQAICMSPDSDPALVNDVFARSPVETFRQFAAQSPLLTEETARALIKDRNSSVSIDAQQSPGLTLDIVREFGEANAWDTRACRYVLLAPCVDDDLALEALAMNPGNSITLVRNENLTGKLLMILTQEYGGWEIYDDLLDHPAITSDIIEAVWDKTEEAGGFVNPDRLIFHKENTSYSLYRKLLNYTDDLKTNINRDSLIKKRRGSCLDQMKKKKIITKKQFTQLRKAIAARDRIVGDMDPKAR